MKARLEKINQDSEALRPAFLLAAKHLESYLDGKTAGSDKIKVAAITVNGYAKVRSTEIHDKALEIMMAKRGPLEITDK